MEDTQIVDVLHIALAEVQRQVELLRHEVQRVERLGLRLRNRWDVPRARQRLVPREAAAGVLDQDALGAGGCCGLVEEERPVVVGVLGVSESVRRQ